MQAFWGDETPVGVGKWILTGISGDEQYCDK